MIKYYFTLLLILSFACKEDVNLKQKNTIKISKDAALTKADIEALSFTEYLLDPKAKVMVSEWTSYQTISEEINKLKQLNVQFYKKDNELFNPTFKEFQTNIPEQLNTQPIKARALVLQTHMLRLKDELGFKKILLKSDIKYVKEVLEAFSNLNLQINKKLEKEAQIIIKP